MSFTTRGYTTDGTTWEDDKGSTNCDLHIPHKAVGNEIASLLAGIDGVGAEAARRVGKQIDENFNEIERWAAYFFRNCVCHCSEDAPE
jgi:hypothetical protein